MNSSLRITQEIQSSIWKNISENEAIGLNVIRKLDRMDRIQVVYAEKLINEILMKGLSNDLSTETTIKSTIEPNHPLLDVSGRQLLFGCSNPFQSEISYE